MRNLVARNLIPVITVLTVAMIATYFIVIGVSAVQWTRENVGQNLLGLQDIVEGEAFSKDRDTRRFLYFYRPQTGIVIDGNMQDWEAAHEAAVGQLAPSPFSIALPDRPQSWLASDFYRENPHASYMTPYTINAIQVLEGQRHKPIQNVPTLRLRFARNSGNELYLLGHMVNIGSGKSIRLSLTVYDRNLKERVFTILPERDGNLKIYLRKYAETAYSHEKVATEEAFGKWWELGQDEFFELALHNVQEDDAIKPIAYIQEGDETLFGIDLSDQSQFPIPLFLMGPRERLPLNDEISTYEIASLLRHLTRSSGILPNYEVSRGEHTLLSSSAADENSDTPLFGLLRLVHRSSLALSRVQPCNSLNLTNNEFGQSNQSERERVCFLPTEQGYRLRWEKILEEKNQRIVASGMQNSVESARPEGDVPPIVIATEKLLDISFPGKDLVIPVVVLMAFLSAYTESRRRHAYRTLEQSNKELERTHSRLEETNKELRKSNDKLELARNNLEQSNKQLEQANKAISSYADTFLHQAGRLLNAVHNRARELVNSEDGAERTEHLENIEGDVRRIKSRLRSSKNAFAYEDIVREEIKNYQKYDGFDLYDSIVNAVERAVEEFEERYEINANVEFCPSKWEGCRRPILSATGAEHEQDDRFGEAIEIIVDNALRYHRPQGSTIIVSLEMEQNWAVIKVSNDGPTVDKTKLEDAFNLGESYAGTAEDSASLPASQDGEDHLGLGLFLLRQIVRAYRGSCWMDNRDDGSGVVVTVRLPVVL